MEDQEMQLKVKRGSYFSDCCQWDSFDSMFVIHNAPFAFTVSDKFTESMYVLANEPSVALYRLQEHVRRSLPELVQHKVWDAESSSI